MPTTTQRERTDELLQLLSHQHRREILYWLRTKPDKSATLDELTEYLDSSSVGSVSDIELYHVLLPKLDESEWAQWHTQESMIQYYPDRLCEELLRVLRSREG
ncbi:hypothetical protein [Natrinema marinum]|uniref:hypothetical protein n=1 Tax=Natrinema marinum TaxID=2961598 RepID=UPI0020C92ADA|nr:hypothetical protein [Natrinema marinum]